ncbi:MAG: D-Ala-D-Ala carboxypeptidase family metallohydrolase [Methylophaga sp.]|nr:D-Ala-D-Ala carboxypeptidase family metallohydrolase [Methylophaga sp.]
MGDLSKNFSRHEFACKCGCGFDTADIELVTVLQDVRDHFNRAVTINSGCRCVEYNRQIGGAPDSQHTKCRAADIVVEDTPPRVVHFYLSEQYDGRFGLGRYDSFTHIDTRSGGAARWG